MQDNTGTELVVGQAVVVYSQFGLKRGTFIGSRPCNNAYVKRIREHIEHPEHPPAQWANTYYTPERLASLINTYIVRLEDGTIKCSNNLKTIIIV